MSNACACTLVFLSSITRRVIKSPSSDAAAAAAAAAPADAAQVIFVIFFCQPTGGYAGRTDDDARQQ